MNLVVIVQAGAGPLKLISATDKPRSIERAVERVKPAAKPVESGAQNDPALVGQPGSRHPNTGGSNAPAG